MKVEFLADLYGKVSSHRDRRLFTEFLVNGYRLTTLDSVTAEHRDDVIYAKVCLGMLITLYDDLADNPALLNPEILKGLYRINIGELPSHVDEPISRMACFLFKELETSLQRLPHFDLLLDILIFDVRQIFLANQYSELMSAKPEIRNLSESKAHGPYNMGMVAAGMIDLMGSKDFKAGELGKMRELFIRGQRLGRIGNLIHTFEREKGEGDLTNEMLLHPEGVEVAIRELLDELEAGLANMTEHKSYAEGVSHLYELHSLMAGII